MSKIMTVLGPIVPENLGFTSMHEHILYDGCFFHDRFGFAIPPDAPVQVDEKVRLDNLGWLKHGFIMSMDALVMKDEDLMAAELADFKSEGGSSVVDMSAPGLRVDPEATRRVSAKSGVHIIAPTGFYSRDSWPKKFTGMAIEDMEAYMVQEIENGIEGSKVKPGHIKIAIEEDFVEPEVNALRAAARVALKTGLSITVHMGMLLPAQAGIQIADILKEEDLPAQRVVIAHNDKDFVEHNLNELIQNPNSWKLNLHPAKSLLVRGFNLSIDCFGHFWDAETMGICAMNDWQRMAGLVALIRQGYSKQLVIGTDTFTKILLRRFGGEGYCRLTRFVVPTLKSVGISDEDIRLLTIKNPARILSF